MAAAAFFFIRQFALITYLRHFLESVSLVGAKTLSILLLVIGVADFIGTTLIDEFTKKGLHRTLAVIPALIAVLAVSLVSAVIRLWELVATVTSVGWWTWLARALPQDAESGDGLMVANVQLAIIPGATVGRGIYDLQGY